MVARSEGRHVGLPLHRCGIEIKLNHNPPLGRDRLLRRIFFAEFLPRSRLLFGMLDNFRRHVSKGRAQGPCFTISRFVDRQLVSIFPPKEIAGPARRLIGRIDIETKLLGGFPIARRARIAQP